MRNNQRHKYVQKIATVGEVTLSDHKSKLMIFRLETRLRARIRVKRVPRIKFKNLRVPEIADQYRQKIGEIIEANVDDDDDMNDDKTRWDELTELVVNTAKEVCGTELKKVENPWMEGREEELHSLRLRLTRAIDTRNETEIRITLIILMIN